MISTLFAGKMGRCKDSSANEKQIIVTNLKSDMSALQISDVKEKPYNSKEGC